jgi:DNA repair protein RecO (recombination protein O)
MGSPRDYQVEGVVIRLADIAERDRVVTLFTRDEGKLSFVARGARRPGSTLGPRVQMLSRGRFLCVRRRGLHLITQAESVDSYAHVRSDLWATACGLYLAELCDAATVEGVCNRSLYNLLVEALGVANLGKADDVLLRFCEVRLLQHLGFCPSLQRCLNCGAVLRPVQNCLSAALGGALCPDCATVAPDARPLSVDALKVLRFWLANTLAVAGRMKIDTELASEIEGHLWRFTDCVVQREMKSRTWLTRLRTEKLLTVCGEAPTIAEGSEVR